MMVFDCGAVPENLIESELFGHEKGSFTGAIMTRQGLFEMAHGGTLFLDELGELNLELQPKLLRALEQREIRRVGSSKSQKVDVRVIAATNRNLEEEVRAGRFRQDLFYRLSVVRILIPPLRERPEDIPPLVDHFLKTHSFNRTPDGDAAGPGDRPGGPGHAGGLPLARQRARAAQRDRARRLLLRGDHDPACGTSPTSSGSPGTSPGVEAVTGEVTFKDGQGEVGLQLRAGLHPRAAAQEQRQHLPRRPGGRHRPQVLPQADAQVRHRRRGGLGQRVALTPT